MRFSYVVHSSDVSAADQRELMEYGDIEEGVFCSNVGACWESWRATVGGRCAGGCRSEEVIVEVVICCVFAKTTFDVWGRLVVDVASVRVVQ